VIVADAFTPGTFLDAFRFIGDNGSLILTKVGEQLGLSASAIGVSLALALPLGVWLGHLHRGSFLTINVSNVGRALPSLAVVALGLTFLPIGFWDVLVALVVLALPPMLTNAYVAVDEVDADVVEAARAMGMAWWQVLLRVELPLALPLIFAGIRTAAVYVVSTATLAGIAGGGGLGDILFNQASYRLAGVIGAAYCVSALALGADLAFGALQFAVTPRALRRPGKALEPDVVTGVVAVEQ
jgi:osmoprotectant transport system permease protein